MEKKKIYIYMFQPDGGITNYLYIFLNFPIKSAFLEEIRHIQSAMTKD